MPIINTQQLAKISGLSETRIRERVRDPELWQVEGTKRPRGGFIPSIKVGRARMFDQDAALAAIKGHTRRPRTVKPVEDMSWL